MPRITAAICTYDRYDLLPKAVESLLAQDLPAGDFEILVVDNSPDPSAARAFGRRYEGLANLIYRVEEQPGLANARNVAIRACRGEILAFLDDDALADPGWLAALLAAFDRFGPAAVAVGGRIDPLWEKPRPGWLHDELLRYLSLVDLGGALRETEEIEWLAGCNMAFRVSALTPDSFDVALGRQGGGVLLSNEELALMQRLKASGGRVLYAPEARVRHFIPAERLTQVWFRQRAVWQAISDYKLDPADSLRKARDWGAVRRYLKRSRWSWERYRLDDLGEDTADPDRFLRQLWALTVLTHMQLNGFAPLPEVRRGARRGKG